MDIPLESFCIVKASYENHFFSKIVERVEYLSKLHIRALSLCPPLVPVKTAASKKDRHASWRLTCLFGVMIDVSPHPE